MAAGQMLLALDRYLGPSHELVLVGDLSRDDTKEAIAAVQSRYLPRAVIAARDSASPDDTATRSSRLDEIFAGKAIARRRNPCSTSARTSRARSRRSASMRSREAREIALMASKCRASRGVLAPV